MVFFVGVERFKLDMPGSMSLKDKRRQMKSITDRLGSSRLGCACEAGANEYHKSGVVTFACVSPAHEIVEHLLDEAVKTVEKPGVEIVARERWVFSPEDLA